MLDIKRLRSEPEEIKKALERRGIEAPLDEFVELDKKRRELIVEAEEKKALRNKVSDDIAEAKRSGKDAGAQIEDMKRVGEEIKALDALLRDVEWQLDAIVMELPNTPLPDVPEGRDETANLEIRTWGRPPQFDFEPRPHWELGTELDIIDQERGAKVAESRFTLLKGMGARLERSLISFFLNLHTQDHGYTELFPPILVNSESMMGTGQLTKFAHHEMYKLHDDDLYLNPTAEVPVTNIYREQPGATPADLSASINSTRWSWSSSLPRKPPGKSWRSSPSTPRRSSSVWSCPSALWFFAPATWVSPRQRRTTWRCGCHHITVTRRSLPAPTSWTSRPGG
jgi:seryl-tRNA synthetase